MRLRGFSLRLIYCNFEILDMQTSADTNSSALGQHAAGRQMIDRLRQDTREPLG